MLLARYGEQVADQGDTGRSGYVFAAAASVVSGILVATQSRINGEFGLRLGDGALAALISFASGFVILTLALTVSTTGRAGVATIARELRAGELPWWAILGGMGGGFLVLTQGLVAGVLGVALFSVAVVAGQTLGAMWLDARGAAGLARVEMSRTRVLGAVLVVAGVIISVQLWAGSAGLVSWAFALPLVAGAGTGVQQALNGRIRARASSALAATWVNFGVGTLTLSVVWVVLLPVTGGPGTFPTDWWLYAGGLVGTLFIPIQTITVHRIGVLGLGVSLVTGQIVGSIALDLFFPVADGTLGVFTLIGALVTVLGSALVTLSRRQSSG